MKESLFDYEYTYKDDYGVSRRFTLFMVPDYIFFREYIGEECVECKAIPYIADSGLEMLAEGLLKYRVHKPELPKLCFRDKIKECLKILKR